MSMRIPVHMYHDHRKEKNKEQCWKRSREEWKSFSDKEKLKFILRAIDFGKQTSLYKEEPQYIVKMITKEEWKIYLRYCENIVMPPKRPYLLYASRLTFKSSSSLEDFESEVKNKFAELRLKHQIVWFEKFIKIWDVFESKVSNWKENQSPLHLAALKKAFMGEYKQEVTLPKPVIPVFREIVMPYPKCNFEDEPEAPPLTPFDLYCAVFDATFEGTEGRKRPREEYKKLNVHVKNSIVEKVIDFREEFGKRLLKYVDNLSDERRRKFLGFKRKRIIGQLRRDVFEEKYPSRKYPVYKFFLEKGCTQDEGEISDGNERQDPIEEPEKIPEDFSVMKAIQESLSQLDRLGYNFESSDSEMEVD